MARDTASWWLDWSALPERLLWARLLVRADGTAEVLDCDGRRHAFESEVAARMWLLEDEYSLLELLIEEGVVPQSVRPPSASTEDELVRAMKAYAQA